MGGERHSLNYTINWRAGVTRGEGLEESARPDQYPSPFQKEAWPTSIDFYGANYDERDISLLCDFLCEFDDVSGDQLKNSLNTFIFFISFIYRTLRFSKVT